MKRISISVLALATTFFSVQINAQEKEKEDDKAKQIDEVVVTALGIKRNVKSLGYATQNVKSDEITKGGKANALDAINGKVSGVQITNSGGQAGSATNVIIRGYSSITGNNQPLYIIDGIPMDNSTVQTNDALSGTPATNRASDISPDDIESISVLKGGAASALYGIRAANGAIVITTKKGKSGKMNLEFSSNIAFDFANKFPSYSDKFTTGNAGAFLAATTNQWGPAADSGAVYPKGLKRDIDGDGIMDDLSGVPIKVYPNNYKRFFDVGSTMKHYAAITGGTERNSFIASISSHMQDGIIPNQEYNRYSFLFGGTQKFNDKIDVDVKANYITSDGNFFNSWQVSEILGYFNNNYDVRGFPYQDKFGNRTYWHGSLSHPMWTVNRTGEDRKNNRLISSLGVNYKILPNLSINYKIGVDTYSEYRKNYDDIGTAEYAATDYMGGMKEMRINNTDINSDLFLRYDLKVTDDFKLSTMVGHNFYHKNFDNSSVTGTSFILPNLIDINNTSEKINGHYSYKKELMGLFGEVQANYKEMAFLTVTGRNDWASTLPLNNNSFFYPSASLGLVFSEMMNTSAFYGKLRASYAKIANIPEPLQLFTTYVRQDPNIFGNPAYSLSNTRLNENLRPEQITQWEVGTDLNFFKNKIGLDLTYYEKKSIDQIIYAPTAQSTGVSSALSNLGEIENKGVEATLRFNDIVNVSDFRWNSEFNFTKNKGMVNKVGEAGQDQVTLGYAYWGTAEIIAQVGQEMGNIYGYTYEHSTPGDMNSPLLLDPVTGLPRRSASKYIIGNINPDWILGWNNSFSYKNLRFGFTLERKQGGDIYNDYANQAVYTGHSSLTDERYYPDNSPYKATKTFTGVDANGNQVNVPAKLTKAYYTNTYRLADSNFVEDASWWRLRNIYLGYTLPGRLFGNTGIDSLEITVSGRNLWLKTPYSGVDPEVNSYGTGSNGNGIIGIDTNSIPNTKSVDLGVKIKF